MICNGFPNHCCGRCVENGLERAKTEERGNHFGGRFDIIASSLDVIHEEKREMKDDPLGFGLRNAWLLVLYIHKWETDR